MTPAEKIPEAEGRTIVWSSPMRRWAIRRLVLVARWYGLQVTTEHDGKLLHRMNLITVKGRTASIRRWQAYADRAARAVGRWPAKRKGRP